MCNRDNARKTQVGSVMLAELAMGTLGSIAVLTMMFSIKSMYQNLTLAELHDAATRILVDESEKYFSNYLPGQDPYDHERVYTLTDNGVDYTYRQSPDRVREFDWPIPGFSINSHYKTKLVSFETQINNDIIQTPLMFTGWQCTEVKPAFLSTDPQLEYTLAGNGLPRSIGDIDYEFHPDTGRILRTSNTGTKVLIDLEFEPGQRFTRADFVTTGINQELKIAIIFAVTNSVSPARDRPNELYLLFDEIKFGDQDSRPILTDGLATLTSEYVPTGRENGLILHLGDGQMNISAITTLSGQIMFIAQSLNINQQTGRQVYKNILYRINLSPAAQPMLLSRSLVDSIEILNLKTHMADHSSIVISTQFDSVLLSIPVTCRVVFKYEK